jgi:hypothetical protein
MTSAEERYQRTKAALDAARGQEEAACAQMDAARRFGPRSAQRAAAWLAFDTAGAALSAAAAAHITSIEAWLAELRSSP